MKVLVACEFSGIVRDAFLAAGHDAISCDLLPTERPGPHLQQDVLEVLGDGWDMMIAHPPCTYLSNVGVSHLYPNITSCNGVRAVVCGGLRYFAMLEAAVFFNKLRKANIGKIAVENPVPSGYAKKYVGQYDQLVQPWQFGHGETKATCLWLKGLPQLRPTEVVAGREHRLSRLGQTKNRGKLRSITYQGIADAMAAQWGSA